MRKLAMLLVAAGICAHAVACGVKGPVVEARPLWHSAADAPLPGCNLMLLVERESDQLAAITFCNRGKEELRFSYALNVPGDAGSPQHTLLKAGAQARFAVPVSHFLNTYFNGLVDVWNVSAGDAQALSDLRPEVLARPLNTPALTMYSIYPLEETTTFNPKLLVGAIIKQPDGAVIARFRNDARRTVHFDFRVNGFQSAGSHNPRVHLFPDMEAEIPITLTDPADADVEHALIEGFNLRIGLDHGPLISPERNEAAPRRIIPCGAEYLLDTNAAELNARTLYQLAEPTRVILFNCGDSPVSFDPLLAGVDTVECPRATLAPGGEVVLSRNGVAARPERQPRVYIRNVRVGNDAGPLVGELTNRASLFKKAGSFRNSRTAPANSIRSRWATASRPPTAKPRSHSLISPIQRSVSISCCRATSAMRPAIPTLRSGHGSACMARCGRCPLKRLARSAPRKRMPV